MSSHLQKQLQALAQSGVQSAISGIGRGIEKESLRVTADGTLAQVLRSLRSLRGLYVDCGWRDQYHIHYGCRILARRLSAAGIAHRYEEFDDDHSDIDYRMDLSLPFLARALRA